ncbi:MAG TPA: glycine cleavage system protein GcvH [Actinomycetaceae bacterium]|nr:glycine cleavage system protein GcvH [Actinomycetaceae bacterium]
MSVPTDRRYTRDHEWFLLEGDVAKVGITAFAADALGDVVFVEPPAAGDSLTAGETCGEVESTKSVSDLLAPASGEVVEANGAVENAPETINQDPYGAGWIYSMSVTEEGELLDAAEYEELIAGEDA